MGGQNAAVVLADADVEAAAGMIASAAMGYAGQKCTATGRVVCEQPVLSDMRDALADAIGRMVVEGPEDPGCQVGPLITPARASARWAQSRGQRMRVAASSPAEMPWTPPGTTCSRP
jgi:aldehyde dehydrogenase (NAD+)